MNVRHEAAGPIDEAATGTRARQPDVARPEGQAARALVHGADPRLAHAGSATPGLMALQRSAGNAAVASLVRRPAVQREVTIDEVTTEVGTEPAGPAAPASTPAGGTGAGAVTSDGATTTITGGTIQLAAPMTEAAGVIRADTIIADSVVASSYTPGAGNVW